MAKSRIKQMFELEIEFIPNEDKNEWLEARNWKYPPNKLKEILTHRIELDPTKHILFFVERKTIKTM